MQLENIKQSLLILSMHWMHETQQVLYHPVMHMFHITALLNTETNKKSVNLYLQHNAVTLTGQMEQIQCIFIVK